MYTNKDSNLISGLGRCLCNKTGSPIWSANDFSRIKSVSLGDLQFDSKDSLSYGPSNSNSISLLCSISWTLPGVIKSIGFLVLSVSTGGLLDCINLWLGLLEICVLLVGTNVASSFDCQY